jgi:iodotyrosine deiodinase
MKQTPDNFIPYTRETYDADTMSKRSKSFYDFMDQRRTIREFSDRPVPREVIEHLLLAASTAPSGAHKQPWSFCAVSNPDLKRKIREAAEAEEYESYTRRMSQEWLDDLSAFGTDWNKPFLEIAPWLIIVFKHAYDVVDGKTKKNYYVSESVGIAAGMLLAAVHNAGLVALTHTPSPMGFLAELLERPENEKPFLLIPVGYPAENAKVPDLKRKATGEIIRWYE